jgi:hypothetical protein
MTTEPYTGATQYQADTLAILREAEGLDVQNREDQRAAEDIRNKARQLLAAADAERAERKRPHLDAGKAIEDEYRKPIANCKEAMATAEASIDKFRRRMEVARKAEEQRLLAQQEKERLRLAKQAERAEAKGLEETADALRLQADTMPPAYVPSRAAKPETLTVVKVWKFQITDPDLVPRDLCMPDESAIRQRVQQLRSGAINTIPGVRVYEKEEYRSK